MSNLSQIKYNAYRVFCFIIRSNKPFTITQSVRVNIIPVSDEEVEIIEENI